MQIDEFPVDTRWGDPVACCDRLRRRRATTVS